jgi:hypothetical protein
MRLPYLEQAEARPKSATLEGALGRIDLMLDVLNALNDTAEEAVATDNLFSPNIGQPTVFVDPRRVMLSALLNLWR